jgi:hypothetical protein
MRALQLCLFVVVAHLLATPLHSQGLLEKLERSLGGRSTPREAQPASELRGYLGLSADQLQPGFIGVVKVEENSPAAKAGIRRGDQLVVINGRRITTLDDVDQVMRVPVGARLDIVTRRAGVERRVQLTLTEPPPVETGEAMEDDELPPPPLPADMDEDMPAAEQNQYATLGVSVVDVTAENRNRYRFPTTQGAVITSIVEGSPAAQYGLPLGGAIVAVDGQRIDSSSDLVATIQMYKPGDEVELLYYQGNLAARKKVRLGFGAPPVVVPRDGAAAAGQPSDPPLRLGPSRRDRPLLNRLERALDDIVPSVVGAATGEAGREASDPAAGAPATSADEVAQLRAEVATLQKQLELMQQRIQQLEEAMNKKDKDQ